MNRWSWLDLIVAIPLVIFLLAAYAFMVDSGGERYPITLLYAVIGVSIFLRYAENCRTLWHWLKLLLVAAFWLPACAIYAMLWLIALLPCEEVRIMVDHR